MNKTLKIIAVFAALAAGASLLWFDYSFTVLGEEKSFGRTFIFAEPIKVLYLSILLIFFGTIGLARVLKKK